MQQFFCWVPLSSVQGIKVSGFVARQQKTTFERDTATPSSCDPFARVTVILSPEGGASDRESCNESDEPSLNSLDAATSSNLPWSLSVRVTDTDDLSVVPSKLSNRPVPVATLCDSVIVRSPSSPSFEMGLKYTSIPIDSPHCNGSSSSFVST